MIYLHLTLIAWFQIMVNGNANINIVFIIVDDLRPLPDKSIELPNIEKLSREGVTFKNSFAQQALCAPSRNSMLTGRRPDSLRLYDFYSYWRDSVGNFTTIPQFFKNNGYKTYSIGKVFHPGKSSNFSDDYPLSWSAVPYHPSTEKYKNAALCKDRRTNTLQRNLLCPVDVRKQPEKTLPDIQSVEYAVNVLKSHNNSQNPLFLAIGLHKPHIPLRYPREYLEKIPKDRVTLPEHPTIPENLPTVAWHPWTDVRSRDDIARLNISFPYGLMPHKWSRKIRQNYYAATMYADNLIGILMKHIDINSTLIILTSDHGWSLGENGLWAKYSNFDVALQVPLVFNIPKTKPKEIHAPVELVDIFPTIVEIVAPNVVVPKCKGRADNSVLCFEGKSLVPYINNEVANNEDSVAISQYPRPSAKPHRNSDKPRLKNIKIMGYSVRNETYRYTEWIGFNNSCFTRDWTKNYGIELYDHSIDPYEFNNVYNDENYKRVVEDMSKLLRAKLNY